MMLSTIRYRAGQRIDTRNILKVVDLPASQWDPIHAAYPELGEVGLEATFRGTPNTTIFPPDVYVSTRALQRIAGLRSSTHTPYPIYEDMNGRRTLVAVVSEVRGGYVSLYIYRAKPSRRTRRR
jgi:hypothetical protein